MTPLQAAARFAAYVWYLDNRRGQRRIAEDEAMRFSRESWKAFIPVAHEGLGRLLLQVSQLPAPAKGGNGGRKRWTHKPAVLAAAL